MKNYHLGLIVRVLLCFIPIWVFSIIFTPLTIYGSYVLLLGYGPGLVDQMITISGFSFEFIEACVASFAYLFFWVLVMLTKGINIKTRVKMVVVGFVLIYLMNVLRIGFIISLALDHGFFWFNVVHLFFWKFLSGVYVALVWILLVKLYKVKGIPIYDDMKTLCKEAFRN